MSRFSKKQKEEIASHIKAIFIHQGKYFPNTTLEYIKPFTNDLEATTFPFDYIIRGIDTLKTYKIEEISYFNFERAIKGLIISKTDVLNIKDVPDEEKQANIDKIDRLKAEYGNDWFKHWRELNEKEND